MSEKDPERDSEQQHSSARRPSSIAWRLRWVLHGLRMSLHLPRIAGRILMWCWIVVAVGFLVLRYLLMPQVAAHRSDIEAALSRSFGLRVEIAQLDASWPGLRPELRLHGMRIFDRQDREALELPAVDVAIAWSSLWRGRLEFQHLHIENPELTIRREADGRIFVAGIPMEPGKGDGRFGDFILQQHEIRIDNARLTWLDQQRNAPELRFDDLSLLLQNSGDAHRFALKGTPAGNLSGPLDLRGDLRGTHAADLANWRGTFYLTFEGGNLAVWSKWIDYPVALPQGRGGVRAWLNFDGPRVGGLTADLQLADVQTRLADDLPMLALKSFSGRVRATVHGEDFSFAAERVSLATQDGLSMGPTQMSLRRTAAAQGKTAGGEISSDKVDLRILSQLASYAPVPPAVRQRLQGLDPRGQVNTLRLTWQDPVEGQQVPAHFSVDANFERLSVRSDQSAPGVEALTGRVKGTDKSGEFQLVVQNGSLDLPGVFHERRVELQNAAAKGSWDHDRKGVLGVEVSRLQVANADANGEFSGSWRHEPAHAGSIELSGRLQRAEAAAVWRYMPLVVPEHTVEWLRNGLQSGSAQNVKLHLAGDLSHFPFRDNPKGIFRIEGRLAGVNLDFAPNHSWPVLENLQGDILFDKVRMLVRAQSGRYRQVRLGEVTAEIPDLANTANLPLRIVGHAVGPGNDMLDYVRASPVAQHLGGFIQNVKQEGDGVLDLKLQIPLHEAEHTHVQGSYRLDNNVLQLASALPPFRQVRGTLTFSEHGIGPTQASAEFLGGTVNATGRTLPDGVIQFDASGQVPATGLKQIIDTPVWGFLSGQTNATARITVGKGRADVVVNSELQGIASSMPAPLAKAAEERLPFTFAWSNFDEVPAGAAARNATANIQEYRVNLGGKGGAQWQDRCPPREGCSFLRGAIVLNDTLTLPARGLRVSGRVKTLELDGWRPVIAAITATASTAGTTGGTTTAGKATSATASGANMFSGAVLQAEEVLAGGHTFANVVARAVQQGDHWVLRLAGPDIAGDVTWAGGGRGRLVARLGTLRLHPVAKEDGKDGKDGKAKPPAADKQDELPDLDIVADQFELRDMKLGKLTLRAENEGPLWRLPQLRIENADGIIAGEGSSRTLDDGSKQTSMTLSIDSENVGGLLGRIGYPEALRKGKAELRGQVSWTGSATSVDFASLDGKLRLDARDGQFNRLEPGAGRLLGILSLQSLPRRITLDFRDVFSEGFAFDAIDGDFILQRGVLRSDNLDVRGPAAKVFMHGSTDLVHETHAIRITVQPTLSEGVAIGLGAASLNPVLGVGVYLAQKILRDPFEKLFSFDYSVTGSWSEPKIEKLGIASAQTMQSGPVAPQ